MSFKTSLTKKVIKWTPQKLILWLVNLTLKDIAELTAFSFDLEARKIHMQLQLLGESEAIDVWFEEFAIITNEGSYQLIIGQTQSNRLWLDNLLSRIAGKPWDIPVTDEMSSQIEFIAELLKPQTPVEEDA
ncbi:MAG: hypothetical protein ABGX37_02840 [Methylococcales bacterium]|jgi:hypothetical protein